MAANIVTLTDANFDEEVGASAVPLVVDFWAEWCGPCRMIAPVLEQIATEKAGSIRIGKLNVDHNPATAQRFDVMTIPTLIVFSEGVAKKRVVGAKGKSQLLADFAEFMPS